MKLKILLGLIITALIAGVFYLISDNQVEISQKGQTTNDLNSGGSSIDLEKPPFIK